MIVNIFSCFTNYSFYHVIGSSSKNIYNKRKPQDTAKRK